MPDFTVHQYGTDSSGRPVLMTAYMADWFEAVVAELGFRPTIVQGAFMSRVPGGGADASAGYHDLAGCLDLRVWDLTPTQQQTVIRVTRKHAAASWLRDQTHGGFDPHIHLVLGTDSPLSSGAAYQWHDYINGGDGMGGRDYLPRPVPLVLTPPEVDPMADYASQLDAIQKSADLAVQILTDERKKSRDRVTRVLGRLATIRDQAKDDATKKDLQAAVDELTADQ